MVAVRIGLRTRFLQSSPFERSVKRRAADGTYIRDNDKSNMVHRVPWRAGIMTSTVVG